MRLRISIRGHVRPSVRMSRVIFERRIWPVLREKVIKWHYNKWYNEWQWNSRIWCTPTVLVSISLFILFLWKFIIYRKGLWPLFHCHRKLVPTIRDHNNNKLLTLLIIVKLFFCFMYQILDILLINSFCFYFEISNVRNTISIKLSYIEPAYLQR